MATSRVSVVLTPSLAALLSDISAETGDSVSSLVRGLLAQSEPSLSRMLQLLRAAREAKGQIGQGLGDAMKRVVDDLESAISVADSRMVQAQHDLVSQAEEVKGRRRRGVRPQGAQTAAPVSSTPVPVTRGSGGERGGKLLDKTTVRKGSRHVPV